jgi:FdhE protein
MNLSFAQKKDLVEHMMAKKPEYAEILLFYEKILELQSRATPHLYLKVTNLENPLMNISQKEGFPLISSHEFMIDLPASSVLFEEICNTAKNANEKMANVIRTLEEAFSVNALRREDLLKRSADEEYIDSVMRDFNVDKAVLKFLVHMSIYPSLNAQAEMLKDQIDLKQWLRGYCPICGSPPHISRFNAEGQRSYLCSFCGFEWPGERLKCPFCENTDHGKLHYFYTEGDDAYRADLCDNCKQYIKTVDSRKLDYEPDLSLEDIVTIHLDILASEKGYKRPVASPWGV